MDMKEIFNALRCRKDPLFSHLDTIQINVMSKYILSDLNKKDGDNFSIPVAQVFVSQSDELSKKLVEFYDKLIPDGVDVDESIAVCQALALLGVVYGYNMEKDTLDVYTAYTPLISKLGNNKFTLEKVLENNRNGIIHAVRLDENNGEVKAVTLNKNTNLKLIDLETGEGRFFLIPEIALRMSKKFFINQFKDGKVLKIEQSKNGINKVRLVATNKDILAEYCDDEGFARSLEVDDYTEKGYFYAPVIGSPSTTLGKTRIDYIDICRVEVVKPENINVKKPVNPVGELIEIEVINTMLAQMYHDSEDEYMVFISNALGVDESLSLGAIGSLINNPVDGDNVRTILKAKLPGYQEVYNRYYDCFVGKSELVDRSEYDTTDKLKKLLRDGVYRITTTTSTGKYSANIVTNSKIELSKIYGNDYFGKYESLGVRVYAFENMFLSENKSSDEIGKYCGLDVKGKYKEIKDIYNSYPNEFDRHNKLVELFGGKARKSAEDSDCILARKVFATKNIDEVKDFYTYIYASKIKSVVRL